MEVIDVLGSFHNRVDLGGLNIYMPYIPISLSELLACPWFSPHPPPQNTHTSIKAGRVGEPARFTLLSKSIAYQVLNTLAYLHDPSRRIAHRDIKPDNVFCSPKKDASSSSNLALRTNPHRPPPSVSVILFYRRAKWFWWVCFVDSLPFVSGS